MWGLFEGMFVARVVAECLLLDWRLFSFLLLGSITRNETTRRGRVGGIYVLYP